MFGSNAFCEELTMKLTTPSVTRQAHTLVAAKPTVEKKTSVPTKAPKKNDPSAEEVKGRIFAVAVPETKIFAERSYKSRPYSTVKKGTRLAVSEEKGLWYGIIMSNGKTGWILKENVEDTNERFTGTKTTPNQNMRTTLASRGDTASRMRAVSDMLLRLPERFLNTKYIYGGTDPNTGMDCSAFVRMIYAESGISLPRTAREQAEIGATVPFDILMPGDRIYFRFKKEYIDHCGIYCGGGYFVHCNSAKNGITLDDLTLDKYLNALVIAKRGGK